ncbi:MAG: hypothetical protein JSS78_11695 [Bacteroidetes bacterium]|nr:hypothetical protein [Bacteroidota bacterium]
MQQRYDRIGENTDAKCKIRLKWGIKTIGDSYTNESLFPSASAISVRCAIQRIPYVTDLV